MTGFIASASLLLIVALIWGLRPLLRTAPSGEAADPELDATRAFLVRQQQELERDLAAGRLAAEDASVLRDDIARRMLQAAESETRQRASPDGTRFAVVAGLAAILPLGTVLTYLAVGTPSAITGIITGPAGAAGVSASEADGGHSKSDLERMVGQLTERLQKNPADLDGRVLLGRTLASLERWKEAREAFVQALAQAPDEPALHAQLGEVMTLEAGDSVTDEAAAEFNKAPGDPRSRYYLALREAEQGRVEAARAQLKALAAEAPPDASWRQIVVERLRDLGGTEPPIASAPGATASAADAPTPDPSAPGPTQQDMRAAASMTPQDRQEMIKGMVARLASRLAQDPSDSAGWDRLARAYDVLGESDKAEAARHHQVAPDSVSSAPVADARTAPPKTETAIPASVKAVPEAAESDRAADGWLQRARALQAAGNEAGALDALRQGTEALPTNRDLLMAYADGLATGIKGDHLPAAFIAVMRRINALDPDQSDALWYLGLAAASNGDTHRAGVYWRRLLDRLPIDSDERNKVKRRLDALP